MIEPLFCLNLHFNRFGKAVVRVDGDGAFAFALCLDLAFLADSRHFLVAAVVSQLGRMLLRDQLLILLQLDHLRLDLGFLARLQREARLLHLQALGVGAFLVVAANIRVHRGAGLDIDLLAVLLDEGLGISFEGYALLHAFLRLLVTLLQNFLPIHP